MQRRTTSRSWLWLPLLALLGCTQSTDSPTSFAQTQDSTARADSLTAVIKGPGAEAPPSPTASAHWDIHDLFRPENSDVVNLIAEEKYGAAARKAAKFLDDKGKNLTESQRANLRYMNIYANAGLAYEGKTKNSEVGTLAAGYVGEWLTSQHLPVTDEPGQPFNQIRVEQDSPDSIMVSCANDAGLSIFAFLHVGFAKRPDLEAFVGKRAYLHGRLVRARPHRDDSNVWIISLFLSDGELHVLDDEF